MTERDARDEAHARYQGDVDGATGEPVDDWGYACAQRDAFVAGAMWQSAHPTGLSAEAYGAAAGAFIDSCGSIVAAVDAALPFLSRRVMPSVEDIAAAIQTRWIETEDARPIAEHPGYGTEYEVHEHPGGIAWRAAEATIALLPGRSVASVRREALIDALVELDEAYLVSGTPRASRTQWEMGAASVLAGLRDLATKDDPRG